MGNLLLGHPVPVLVAADLVLANPTYRLGGLRAAPVCSVFSLSRRSSRCHEGPCCLARILHRVCSSKFCAGWSLMIGPFHASCQNREWFGHEISEQTLHDAIPALMATPAETA